MTFKASDLLRKDHDLEKQRRKNYKIEFQKCLYAIQRVHENIQDQPYTTYTVPYNLNGDYDVEECTAYLKEHLRNAEFFVKIMKPGNVLFISWMPEHVEKAKKAIETKKKLNPPPPVVKKSPKRSFVYNPHSVFSNLSLRAEMMKSNPKYDHLPTMQKWKKKNQKS